MPTLIYRDVGDFTHILNYTRNDIFSFNKTDAHVILDDINAAISDPEMLNENTRDFLSFTGSTFSSRAFRSSLINLGMEFDFPTVANLELNRRCVLRCQHCYIPLHDLTAKNDSAFESRTIDQIEKTLDSLKSLGVFLLVLTGGEVFLNRRLEPILTMLQDRGFILEIFTSLQFLPDWFKKLDPIDSRIGRIQTSVYSVSGLVHDEVTGIKGSMKRTLDTLSYLYDRGFYVEVATPLMQSNFDARHEIVDYFESRGIKQSFAWPILSEYYDGIEKKAMLNVSEEQFVQFCSERPDYLIELDTKSNPDASICPAGKAVLSVSANGDVFSCSQYPLAIGNINDAPVDQIFRSSAMREIASRRMKDIPDGILPYNYCMGNNYSETGDPMKQSPVLYQLLAANEKATTATK